MASDRVLIGRPYGGCAILYRNWLSTCFSPCPKVSRSFCAGEISLVDGRLLLLVCLYLPYDDGMVSDAYKFVEVLGELQGFLDSRHFDLLSIVGDFNVDFTRTHRPRTDELLCFMRATGLVASDLQSPSIQFTYESDSGLTRSWVDHVLFFVEASSYIKHVVTLHSGANLSDHLPLLVSIDCQPRMSLLGMQRSLPSALQRRVAWYKASEEQIETYQSRMLEAVSQLAIPDQLVNCLDPHCSVHFNLLNSICDKLVHCLVSCDECVIPLVSTKKIVANWNTEVRSLREKSLFWNRIWQENGCPQAGAVFQVRKHAKSRYWHAARRAVRNQEKLRRKQMAAALLQDKSRNFWR